MKSFDHIAIIYNPISTGNAPAIAKNLAKQIERHSKTIGTRPTLTPTKYARHAEALAEKISSDYRRPLIISVSGDGGYNEVVNGAMKAKRHSKNSRPVVAVAGAGNANDHRRVMRDTPLIDLIVAGSAKPMDLIHITASNSNKSFSRYAHSYIGFGISPQVAVELNRHELNWFRESIIAIRSFLAFTPFYVEYENKRRTLDSLIFANIDEMAKILKFKDSLNINDNRFEVVEFRHEGKFKLLYHLLKAAVIGLKNQPQYETYTFKLFGTSSAQLDGEVDTLPAKSTIIIESKPKAIDSLYE